MPKLYGYSSESEAADEPAVDDRVEKRQAEPPVSDGIKYYPGAIVSPPVEP